MDSIATAVAAAVDSTSRAADELLLGSLADQLAAPKLPSLDDVREVAQSFGWHRLAEAQNEALPGCGSGPVWGTTEGRSFSLVLSPGVVAVSTHDEVKRERTRERVIARQRSTADLAGGWVTSTVDESTGEITDTPHDVPGFVEVVTVPGRQVITEWSRKSRSNMVKQLGMLDYSVWVGGSGVLAMVTLTYPGDWLAVVPTGKDFKRHMGAFRKRWERAVGPWVCLWKMEFQRRGAPHLHLLMKVPATAGQGYFDAWGREDGFGLCTVRPLRFEVWLSRTWADVVDHPDPEERRRHELAGTGVDFSGARFSDPRRISMYFLGHSSKGLDGKEYQHIVPMEWREEGAGPGRFWGSAGLPKGSVEVALQPDEYFRVRRVLRKLLRARNWRTAVIRERSIAKQEGRKPLPPHRVRVPRSWTLGSGGGIFGGYVLMNDGVGVGVALSQLLGTGPGLWVPGDFSPAPSWVDLLRRQVKAS